MAEEEKITVSVDPESCIGCQHCVEICPKVFSYNSSLGVAEADSGAAQDCDCNLKEVAAGCPVGAIEIQ